jgi:hypothetical protein
VTGRQNAHLTFKGNSGVGRHGWLRLTPAYSVRLVREYVSTLSPDTVVTDPFSGTATTALASAEYGLRAQACDINPFLIWLGTAKTRHYPPATLARARRAKASVVRDAANDLGRADRWQPPLANIDRWWSAPALDGLKALRAALDLRPAGPVRDLLDIAFCRTLIDTSNAAFNHQSMSFKQSSGPAVESPLTVFGREAETILASAAAPLPGQAILVRADARSFDSADLLPCDLLLTSPPYVNRMSYVRELRPYMYWLRYLDEPADASTLDWTAIGGTWGTATSRLATWRPGEDTPLADRLDDLCERIAGDGGRTGTLLATYVRKYFTDMWEHFGGAYKHVRSGGRVTYIVGNSTFSGHVVPVNDWYGILLREAGFTSVKETVIRKRNSHKALFEFAITAVRP